MKGSTTSISSTDGSYKLVYAYDIYGEPVRKGDKDFYNEITFTGAVYDEETGLFYLSSRYYDPTTGRFTSTDEYQGELDNPISLNGYIYCNDNPVKYTDNDGHLPTIIIGMVGGALKGAISAGADEFITQVIDKGKVDWKKVAKKAGIGAFTGAARGAIDSTIGPLGSGVAEAGISYVEDILNQCADNDNNGDVDVLHATKTAISSGVKKGGKKAALKKMKKTSDRYKELTKRAKKSKKKQRRNIKKKITKSMKTVHKIYKKIKTRTYKVIKKVAKVAKKIVKKIIAKPKKAIRNIKRFARRTTRKIARFFSRFRWRRRR